jgi:hypothetical protein
MRAPTVTVFVLWIATLAGAAQFEAFDRAAQVRGSDLVVLGRVVEVRSGWNADRSAIVTEARVAVDEVWKGLPETDVVVVRTWGGVAGGVEQVFEGEAELRRGEEVVLFLRRDGDAWRPAGMAFGKYAVEGNGDGAFLIGSLPPAVSGAQRFEQVSVAIEELRREVARLLAGGLP